MGLLFLQFVTSLTLTTWVLETSTTIISNNNTNNGTSNTQENKSPEAEDSSQETLLIFLFTLWCMTGLFGCAHYCVDGLLLMVRLTLLRTTACVLVPAYDSSTTPRLLDMPRGGALASFDLKARYGLSESQQSYLYLYSGASQGIFWNRY